jgi:hypothetical protein
MTLPNVWAIALQHWADEKLSGGVALSKEE